MFKFLFVLLLSGIAIQANVYGQDTLPKISVVDRFGKIIISWKNVYGATITNINIQRSTDSIKRFTTIGSVLNPMNTENGYVDRKSPGGKLFYRVFVAFDGGDYLFSKSYQPVIDTSREIVVVEAEKEKDKIEVVEEKKEKPKPVPPPVFVPSKFVFTGKDNNVILNLPDAESQKFSIQFFEENGTPMFELHSIKESYLILEKVNFVHAGWFNYHLFNNNILLEKFKFYIPKDGKINNNGRDQRN